MIKDTEAELRARIAKLEGELATLRPPVDVDIPESAMWEAYKRPSSRQLLRLFEISARTVPQLGAQTNFEAFAAAFHFLGACKQHQRIDGEVDRHHELGFWTDWCESWNGGVSIDAYSLLLGAAGHADIPYRLRHNSGVTFGIGLVVGSRAKSAPYESPRQSGSRPAKNLWLAVLQEGRAGLPLPLPHVRKSPVMVRVTGAAPSNDGGTTVTEY